MVRVEFFQDSPRSQSWYHTPFWANLLPWCHPFVYAFAMILNFPEHWVILWWQTPSKTILWAWHILTSTGDDEANKGGEWFESPLIRLFTRPESNFMMHLSDHTLQALTPFSLLASLASLACKLTWLSCVVDELDTELQAADEGDGESRRSQYCG